MSCQDDCEAISELSGVRSATFVAAGSWCLPGACGPNRGLFAEPGGGSCNLLSLRLIDDSLVFASTTITGFPVVSHLFFF